ncbi:MAG: hypothetical protein FWD79_02290 [Desulfobulbus sp.]|nr:hypothetical protein [Desulfobulbus sp.]
MAEVSAVSKGFGGQIKRLTGATMPGLDQYEQHIAPQIPATDQGTL